MTKTVIQVRKETREKLKSLGRMGDTYDDVISRMYDASIENMMSATLLDTSDSVAIEDILRKRNLL
ncbi:MAG: hypothetical protein ACMXYD_01470 [Candidatus Woesearchaeota archaeon]